MAYAAGLDPVPSGWGFESLRSYHEGENVKKLQREIGEWGDKTFPASDKVEKMSGIVHHLDDEVHELMSESLMMSVGMERQDQIRMEVADVFILAFQLAYTLGFDAELAVQEKMDINKKRKWGDPDSRGVVKHLP